MCNCKSCRRKTALRSFQTGYAAAEEKDPREAAEAAFVAGFDAAPADDQAGISDFLAQLNGMFGEMEGKVGTPIIISASTTAEEIMAQLPDVIPEEIKAQIAATMLARRAEMMPEAGESKSSAPEGRRRKH